MMRTLIDSEMDLVAGGALQQVSIVLASAFSLAAQFGNHSSNTVADTILNIVTSGPGATASGTSLVTTPTIGLRSAASAG
jgi:hypothetical protein